MKMLKVTHMKFYASHFADTQLEVLYMSNTAIRSSENKCFPDFAIQLPENHEQHPLVLKNHENYDMPKPFTQNTENMIILFELKV